MNIQNEQTRENVAIMTEHEVLKTIEHVLEKAGEHLNCHELEKLDHAWSVEKSIAQTLDNHIKK